MKRFSGILLAVCMVCFLIVTVAVQAKSPIQINYYTWDDPANKPIVDAFNASQKEIFVNATYLPTAEFENKMTILLAGGADIDCYMQKRTANIFSETANGTIEPLDSYVQKYKFKLEPMKTYAKQVTLNGKLMAIPFRGANYYTFYNKKLFAAAGIPTPTEYVAKGQWTWEKFAETARKLSSGDGKQYGALLHTWPQITLLPAIQEGTDFITPDGKVDVNAKAVLYSMRLRKSLEKDKAIMSLAEQSATKMHYSTAFYSGTVAMVPMGEWFPGWLIKGRDGNLLKGFTYSDWALTRVPCNTPNYTSLGVATFNHIYSRSKNKDAAFKFIAWMGGPKAAPLIAKAGFMPAQINAQVMKVFATTIPDKVSLKYYTEKVNVFPQWFHKYGSKLEVQVLNPLLSQYLSTDMKDDDFIAELEKQCTDLIKSTN